MRLLALVASLSLFASACLGGREPRPTAPPDGVLVRFDEATLAAEVVATTRARARGLMHRRHLDAESGMLFLFKGETSGGFWMKNTLIPLSIAYLGREDDRIFRVLRVLDMTPCRRDPCPEYPPGLSYDAALEVNSGWFAAKGVEPGSVMEVDGTLPNPS